MCNTEQIDSIEGIDEPITIESVSKRYQQMRDSILSAKEKKKSSRK